MIDSLFGDLAPRPLGPPVRDASAEQAADDIAAQPAAGLSTTVTALDLVVDGSAALAMRQHFATHRADLHGASPMITLLDPSRLWAADLVHGLANAGGQPLQRLNLRERATLRTLAVIERALVAQDPDGGCAAPRVYHADIRASPGEAGLDHDDITSALAEASQMTAVLVGTLAPRALAGLLTLLCEAALRPSWRCPRLVFVVAPGDVDAQQQILAQAWPAPLRATVVADPHGSTASVWHNVLNAWLAHPLRIGPPTPGSLAYAQAQAQAQPQPAPEPDNDSLARLLATMARTDGMLACGVVQLPGGHLLASQSGPAGAASLPRLPRQAQAICASLQALHMATDGGQAADDPVDELLVNTGSHQTLLRVLPGDSGLGFVAFVAKSQINLALLRFKLLDVEKLVRTG